MPRSRSGGGRTAAGLIGSALALTVLVAGLAAPAEAQSVVPVSVLPTQVFTDAGIAVRAGDSLKVTATGQMHFGGGGIAALTPTGIAWGNDCKTIAKGQARTTPWPAPGIRCWSLIGRVGTDPPFEIGTSKTFQVDKSGELFLGVNDNHVQDNAGTWSATVVVTPAGSANANGGNHSASKSTVDKKVIAIAGVAVLLLLVLLIFLVRRRTKRRAAPEFDTIPLIGPVTAAVAEAPEPETAPVAPAPPPPRWPPAPPVVDLTGEPMVTTAPPETDSIDVNIFEVEFPDGVTLRVGYNHFPEGTPLQWRVTQNGTVRATGYFVTKGGGSTSHAETIPLGVALAGRDDQPAGADVQFDWTINGVPFQYKVRRDPNC